MANMLISHSLVLHRVGSPASLAPTPTTERAGAVEGLRGRHKSLPQRTRIKIYLGLLLRFLIYMPCGIRFAGCLGEFRHTCGPSGAHKSGIGSRRHRDIGFSQKGAAAPRDAATLKTNEQMQGRKRQQLTILMLLYVFLCLS